MELKYRRLTQEELQEMEKEFIDFLVINGISSDEWLVLKEQNNEKVEKIIDLFSEAVLETVYRKVSYLEHVSAREVLVFHASSASIQLVGLSAKKEHIDFTTLSRSRWQNKDFVNSVQVLFSQKEYVKQREVELFELVENGAQVTDGNLFKQLSLLYASTLT
ncbi:MAG: hypothetical protein ACI92W_000344 [Paraglaciecola sp.]|jgi:hypothetical protein